MLDLNEQLVTLRLFNEKVQELIDSSFVKAITNPKAGFSISAKRDEDGTVKVQSAIDGPSGESVRAFVLTFRFFIQDNEATSLRNIATLYEAENIDAQQREKFQRARENINEMLDATNHFNLSYNGFVPTNRQVMEVFVYGGLAHAAPKKHETYKEWMSSPLTSVILQASFNKTLGDVLHTLAYIQQVNVTVLDLLSNPKP